MKKENKKAVRDNGTEHKTLSAWNTGRKLGRQDSIHTRHRLMETGKQTRNAREGD